MVDTNRITNIAEILTHHHLTIATAESCTGGLLSHYLTSISGSSNYFHSGIITYSNKAKTQLLHVSNSTLQKHGAVSPETAGEMAEGIRKTTHVDIAVSTTGIAGPTGGTKEKPVGLVYIGLAAEKTAKVNKFEFQGNRLQNKESTCEAALTMLYSYLKENE